MSSISTTSRLRFLDVFVAPGAFFLRFDQVRRYSPFILLALIAVIFISHHMFYSAMSDEWLLEQQLLQVGELQPSERDVVHEVLAQNLETAGMFVGGMTAAGYVAQILMLATFYYFSLFLLKTRSGRPTFTEWFNLVCWCQVPWIVNYAVFIFLFSSARSPDLPLSLPYFASVGQLFLDLPVDSRYYRILQSINLFHVWVVFMTASAINRAVGIPYLKALCLAVCPYLVFFAIWWILI